MNPVMRRSVVVSALLHLLILLAALISLPSQPLPEASEGTSFEVEFQSTIKAPVKGPSAKRSPTPSPKPAQPQPPKPQPIADNTAPPPPPPPAPAHAEAAQPIPTPPKPIPLPPAPTPTPTPTPVKLQPVKPTPTPSVEQSIPTPPEPVPAPPSQSATSQPNPAKNTAESSDALEETLAKLRSTTKADQPPTAKANPDNGGSLADTGSPDSDDTSALTADQRGAIGDAVRPCWTRDAGALNADKLQVKLEVETDSAGVVRVVHIAPDDLDRVNADPVLRAFSDRAVNALLDAQCATLPLPPSMLGHNNIFTFRFSP